MEEALANHANFTVPCDVCGALKSKFVLTSPNLDGPLVECPECGLRYVGSRKVDLVFGRDDSGTTVERLRAANLRLEDLPRAEQRRLNELNAGWRLDLIREFKASGRLLEVGCAQGDFLRVASDSFDVFGVEPNPELARDARQDARVHEGLIDDTPWFDFDVVTSFHVIEHVDSPARFVGEMVRRLKPGGLLVLETPNIGSLSFRLLKARWRQFIPEHYFFFDRATITRLLSAQHLAVHRIVSIGKYANLGFILNRLSRHVPFELRNERLMHLFGKRAFRVNPLDIMLVLAAKAEREG